MTIGLDIHLITPLQKFSDIKERVDKRHYFWLK